MTAITTDRPDLKDLHSQTLEIFSDFKQINEKVKFVGDLVSIIKNQQFRDETISEDLLNRLRENIIKCTNIWHKLSDKIQTNHSNQQEALQYASNALLNWTMRNLKPISAFVKAGDILSKVSPERAPTPAQVEQMKGPYMKFKDNLQTQNAVLREIAEAMSNIRSDEWEKILKIFQKNKFKYSESFLSLTSYQKQPA